MEETKEYKDYLKSYAAFTAHCTLSEEALEWLFKYWSESDPFEKKICLIRYYQKKQQSYEYVNEMMKPYL